MSITSSELKFYGSANMPEDDVSTSGGAIDTTVSVIFTDIAATDNVTVISDNAGDTMDITITGRLATGVIDTDVITLTGTTRAAGVKNFERILKIVLDSVATGTITVTRDNSPTYTSIATLDPGILEARRLFYDSAAEASGGSSRDYYEKFFIKNTNSTLSLTNAVIAEYADPGANITFDLEDAVNDTNSISDRLGVAPSGMLGSFSGSNKTVPGTALAAGSAIGVWLKLTLAAGTAAAKNTYTVRITGQST